MTGSDNEYYSDNDMAVEDDEILSDEDFLDKPDDSDNQFTDIENNKLLTLISIDDIQNSYDRSANISDPKLTKYERTKIIGIRAQQIAQGAKPRVKVPSYITDTIEIAELELTNRKIPFLIKRDLPSGKTEYWKIEDMVF